MYTFSFRTEGIQWHHLASESILQIHLLALWSSIIAVSETLSSKSQRQETTEFLGRLSHEGQLRGPSLTLIVSVPNGATCIVSCWVLFYF